MRISEYHITVNVRTVIGIKPRPVRRSRLDSASYYALAHRETRGNGTVRAKSIERAKSVPFDAGATGSKQLSPQRKHSKGSWLAAGRTAIGWSLSPVAICNGDRMESLPCGSMNAERGSASAQPRTRAQAERAYHGAHVCGASDDHCDCRPARAQRAHRSRHWGRQGWQGRSTARANGLNGRGDADVEAFGSTGGGSTGK